MDGGNKYYMPYETAKESESDTTSLASEESLENTAGPDFAEFARQLIFDKSDVYSPYTGNTKLEPDKGPPKTKDMNTLFLIDSQNRDRKAYPQPTSFKLRPPRVYKNVVSIQVTQIKLLSSFFYFRAAKSNIILPVIEQGRETITRYLGYPLTEAVSIDEGTYSINELLAEIQKKMNQTPIFYDFPGGFSDFSALFPVNGDFSINFNQPGDTYYDALNKKYISNPTLLTINSYYWSSRYANIINYTSDEILCAYYYPVLYEAILDIESSSSINLSIPSTYLNTGETAYFHIIFNSSGINDKVILYIIKQNITALDAYRLSHTFRYTLVNRYQLAYDSNNLRVNIFSGSLNTSLVNLINLTNSVNLTNALASLGIANTAAYSNLNASYSIYNAVYFDMYKYLQLQLASYFAVNYGTYSSEYFNDINNSLYIQDGRNASGISKIPGANLNPSLIKSSREVNSNSPGYWPNFNATHNYGGEIDSQSIEANASLIPYDSKIKNFTFGQKLMDSNYYIQTNRLTRTVDVLINIKPARYTIFKFRSQVRQTLQVETLPLPYYYRLADYNKAGYYIGVLDPNKANVPQEYFDISYSYVYDSTNSLMDSDNYASIKLSPIFGQSYSNAYSNIASYTLNSQSNYTQFEFIAPIPQSISTGLIVYNTNISFVSVSPSTYPDTFNAFLYHDRGAFMADIEKIRQENPLHYLQSMYVSSPISSLTFNLSTFAGHTYYIIFRSDKTTCSNITYKPVIYYNDTNYTLFSTNLLSIDPLSNPSASSNINNAEFVINYNTDFIRLPVTSTLSGIDPSNSNYDSNARIYVSPIGYDISGVSNDVTDYIGYNKDTTGFLPNTTYRIDPLNYYSFKKQSQYNSNAGSYFYTSGSNAILQPITNNQYVYKGTSTSQIKIVHWYDGYSIPIQQSDNFTTFNTISTLNTPSMHDYLNEFPVNSNGDIKFGLGVNAIGFVPSDGNYEIDSFMFKSAIYSKNSTTPTTEDPNLQIKYIGVYQGSLLLNNLINISNALTVLKFSEAIVYNSFTTVNIYQNYGTWYNFIYDPTFVSSSDVNISGYTQNTTELLSYDSMYYMVPFDSNYSTLTFASLVGSLLPYPLSQAVSTGITYYGQSTISIIGLNQQPVYIIPSTISGANSAYGPATGIAQTQSQYEQSMPITTTSIGYREHLDLVYNNDSIYSFGTTFSDSLQTINSLSGLTTFFSEYNDALYLVNGSNISQSNISFTGSLYKNSISTIIASNSGNISSIHYLLNLPSITNTTIQNIITTYSTFTFKEMPGNDANITTQRYDLSDSMSTLTIYMWSGGGATWSNPSSIMGGAGAYIQATMEVSTLKANGISSLYMVVGKGGNRDNFSTMEITGIYHGYQQPRYGGGGTSVLSLNGPQGNDSIALQGGGFSGIFSDSNLMSPTTRPILIVGGGGAAGGFDYGGPGGIGLISPVLPVIKYSFSNVTLNTLFYPSISLSSVVNIDTGSNISEVVDSNLTTYWIPSATPLLNPNNLNPTVNTYRLNLQFASDISNISKLRFYANDINQSSNIPTGFIVYNNANKSQVLFSNTSISSGDFDRIDNGTFIQKIYEMKFSSNILTTPSTINGWIVGGSNTSPQNSIQYSLNSKDWVNTTNSNIGSLTSLVYVSDSSGWYASATTGIFNSADGLSWTSIYNTGPVNYISYGNGSIVAAVTGGTSVGNSILVVDAIKVKYLNNAFWAFGGTHDGLKTSPDGTNWNSTIAVVGTPGSSGLIDIAYGLGRYVIAKSPVVGPIYSSLIYRDTSGVWTAGTGVIDNFTANSVAYGATIFVAVGISVDSSSPVKYSSDGKIWLHSKFTSLSVQSLSHVQYLGGEFIAIGISSDNQSSIIRSTDGIIWSYSLSGGFQSNAQAGCIGYGPIKLVPDLRTLYLEIQNTTSYIPYIYEIRGYSSGEAINYSTSNLIDNNIGTIYSPSNSSTIDIINYPFTFTFSSPLHLSTINKIQIYTSTSGLFTGITVQKDQTNTSVIYSNSNITPNDFTMTSGISLFEVSLIPPVSGLSTIYINFNKITSGSIQINEVSAVNDINTQCVLYNVFSITDLDNRSSNQGENLVNSIDGSLITSWIPLNFNLGETLRITCVFSSGIDQINHVQIYNGTYGSTSNLITGIYIYTDVTKTYMLYSNNSPVSKQYLTYNMFDINIVPVNNPTSIYIELTKSTVGKPSINSIQFMRLGPEPGISTPNGYSGGSIFNMQKLSTPYSLYDGGGGTNTMGGQAGNNGFSGKYLAGGSPAYSGNQLSITSFTDIQYGAGGGGGGYYGGGGGGTYYSVNRYIGGAGGGGAGYVDTELVSIIESETANPGTLFEPSNYKIAGESQLNILIEKNTIVPGSYGKGGIKTTDSGKGAHGIIVISYLQSVNVNPPNSNVVVPKFIDGSKLTLYTSPITYNTDTRILNFTTYSEAINTISQYAKYNWVWYSSYLSLVGCSLLKSMVPSSNQPSSNSSYYTCMSGNGVYTILSSQFSTINGFFQGPFSTSNVIPITSTITSAFNIYQTYFAQQVKYTNSNYDKATELYCILDYLKLPSNLANPHVNSQSSQLDRVFGGLPGFGYWANPFLTNVSYIGFDVAPSQPVPSALSSISGSSDPIRAFYGLVLEQSLVTGTFQLIDIMAYKPTINDSAAWQIATQFTESYCIRSIGSNIPVQSFTMPNAMTGTLSLLKYSVYTAPRPIGTNTYNIPIQVINDFSSSNIYLYSFQNTNTNNISTIHIKNMNLPNTTIQLNQNIITQRANNSASILGTLVSENSSGTLVFPITQFGFVNSNAMNYTPVIVYNNSSSNYYNTYASNSPLSNINVGKAIVDSYGNLFSSDRNGTNVLYENIGTSNIYQQPFTLSTIKYASPGNIVSSITSGVTSPYYDFFVSKYTNIWHLQATAGLSKIYGARLTSIYDYTITNNFANNIFYPVHKVVLTKKSSSINPMSITGDYTKYPSYQHTEMFFYDNYTSLSNDINGKFAQENSNNFLYSNMNSGYYFDSYINNIKLDVSDSNSFNYLAIRGYSPSESFQSIVRFYLPRRYDFGYISLSDLSSESASLSYNLNANPDYVNLISSFNSAFSTTKVYGSVGVSGFNGSNISTSGFGDFLSKFNLINSTITSYSYIISTVTGSVNLGLSNLITGDLRYILPSSLASRTRVTDPIIFQLPFSTIVNTSNRGIEEYGLGYNLGFLPVDTSFNTIHRADSFFKILDDYIYLQMNPEYNMNRLDVSQQEDFSQTLDPTSQRNLYNCKLILNTFGSFSTTFVQNPVMFNPPIGKLDKLSFAWYDSTGNIIDNSECEWSGSIQIVEKVEDSS